MYFLTEIKIYLVFSLLHKIEIMNMRVSLMASILKQRRVWDVINIKNTTLKTPQHYTYQDLMEYLLYEMVKIC